MCGAARRTRAGSFAAAIAIAVSFLPENILKLLVRCTDYCTEAS